MGAGRPVSDRVRARIARAVDTAEERTGLQLCVYLGPAEGDPRAHAESLFAAAGARSRPAAMVYVAPDARRVEVVTAEWARERLPDAAAEAVVRVMVSRLRRGRLAAALEEGLRVLAEAAGPPRPGDRPGEELPDVLG